jgi:hypothetical protein
MSPWEVLGWIIVFVVGIKTLKWVGGWFIDD